MKVYGAAAQDTIVSDDSAKLNEDQINLIQQVIGVCLYYGRVVDDTILPALSAIASEQSNGTRRTMEKQSRSWITWQRIQLQRLDITSFPFYLITA